MAGTNVAAAMAALTDLITTALAAEDVGVTYSFSGNAMAGHRDYVYLGDAEGPVEASAMRGSGRIKRFESPTVDVIIRVARPGEKDRRNTDARAVAIGAIIENLLASDHTLGGLTNLRAAEVVGMSLTGAVEDDQVVSELIYQVRLSSYLN